MRALRGLQVHGCTVLVRNVRALALGGLVALTSLVALVAALGLHPAAAPFPLLGVVGSGVFCWSVWRYHALAARRQGVLTVDRRGMTLAGAPLVRRERLSRGVLVAPASTPLRVRLLDLQGERVLDIEVDSPRSAEQILLAGRLDAAHSVASFRLSSRWLGKTPVIVVLSWLPMTLGMLLAVASSSLAVRLGLREGSTPHAVVVGGTLLAAAAGVLVLLRKARLRVDIGPDGVYLRGLRRVRFVCYEDLAEVRPWEGEQTRHGRAVSEGVDLVLKSGERIPLRTLHQRMAGGQNDDVVAEQIEAAMNGRAEQLDASPALLERDRRSGAEWLVHLRRLGGAAAAGYRGGALSEERLLGLLDDPHARPALRLASAVVLCAAEGRRRDAWVRAAATAMARPELRAAVEAVARGEVGAVASALEQLDR